MQKCILTIYIFKNTFLTRQGQLWGGTKFRKFSYAKIMHMYIYTIQNSKIRFIQIFQFPRKVTFFYLFSYFCFICFILYILYLFQLLHYTKTTKNSKSTKTKNHEISTNLTNLTKNAKNTCNNFFDMLLYRYLATKRLAKSQ